MIEKGMHVTIREFVLYTILGTGLLTIPRLLNNYIPYPYTFLILIIIAAVFLAISKKIKNGSLKD